MLNAYTKEIVTLKTLYGQIRQIITLNAYTEESIISKTLYSLI